MRRADVVIIGGGIVGLATAYQLTRPPSRLSVVVLEKEATLAAHQTGRNSGVLHSGVYYQPGSRKATNCRAGKAAMEAFCRDEGVPFDICGKVIVAVTEAEFPSLERIAERGKANGVRCEVIDGGRLRELEPHAAGLRALHVPEAGIVDYAAVCERLAFRIREAGGEIRTRSRVIGMTHSSRSVVVHATTGDIEASRVVNCAGLQCDRVAKMTGKAIPAKIVPFRGEYFTLRPAAQRLCRNLIYPVPDPEFPFLGVHFTRMIAGGVECGPNAVLAFAREGYHKTDIDLSDLVETLTYPGFVRMAMRHWRAGLGEMWRSWNKRAFVRALQRLVPDVRSDDLEPAPAGVRAQAVGVTGALVDDFLIAEGDRVVNVGNAPSPAATAALAIGEYVAGLVTAKRSER